MIVQEICVGLPRDVDFDGKAVRTSIFKNPVAGTVRVRELNIDGDRQSDLTVHGGRDKAVYVYSADYYPEWATQLGVSSLPSSQFGQNLTVIGGTDNHVVIGSRYRLGDVEVTVTQPRIPCFKLGIRLNDKTFPQSFWQAGRLGFYLRVEREGSIEQNLSMELIGAPDHGITVRDLYDAVTTGSAGEATRALENLPHLDSGWIRRLTQVTKSGIG